MIRLENVLKTFSKRLEDVLKTYDQDEYIGLDQDVFWRRVNKANIFILMKTSWRRLLKTKTKDVFRTSSSRQMFAGKALINKLLQICHLAEPGRFLDFKSNFWDFIDKIRLHFLPFNILLIDSRRSCLGTVLVLFIPDTFQNLLLNFTEHDVLTEFIFKNIWFRINCLAHIRTGLLN